MDGRVTGTTRRAVRNDTTPGGLFRDRTGDCPSRQPTYLMWNGWKGWVDLSFYLLFMAHDIPCGRPHFMNT